MVIYCQDIQFTAEAPAIVRLGEQFAIKYTINQRSSNRVNFPEMPGMVKLSGPNTSTSSNFQIINGQQSHTYTTSYTFYVQANEVGKYTINPATVTVNNSQYESNTLVIEVVQGQQGSAGGQQQPGQSNSQSGSEQSNSSGSNVFVVSELNKKDVYVGEQVILSYKVYTKVDLAGFGEVKFPQYTGFWKEDFELGNIGLQSTVYNNQSYRYAEIQRNILFPQRGGEITIPSADIEIISRVKTRAQGYNDPFFNEFFGGYQNVPIKCTTKPLTLNVKPLPAQGKPISFSGAVGNFSIAATIDKTELKANEAITLKFTINGSGNIKLIDKINVKFPSDFETYAPKVTQNIKVDRNSVSGSKIFEYVIIPRNPGTFKIKSFEFSYFDPNKKEYVILNSPEFTIEVANSDIAFQSVPGVSREDVIAIGEDIKHIKPLSSELSKAKLVVFGSSSYLVVLAGILLFLVIVAILIKIFIDKRSDVDNLKRKRAESVAMKRLKKAKQYMDENADTAFYNELSNAMWQYIGDRFNIPISELNRDFLINLPNEYNISSECVNKYISVLDEAEFARFAPSRDNESMHTLYNSALEAIQSFYSTLKKVKK
jgi:hypothetical protein